MWRVIVILCVLLVNCTVVRAELPPDILADKYLIRAEQLHAEKNYAAAFEMMQKTLGLKKEHNLTLPVEFHFKYAQVALSVDSVKIALDSVNRYLSLTGRDGEFYKEALALSLEAEWPEIGDDETCAGKPPGVACWNELTSHPQCYVWDVNYDENRTVSWSGKCSGHVAHGQGTLIVSKGDYETSDSGNFAKGKKHGYWVGHDSYGNGSEGPYVNGKKHGHWILRDSHGGGSEGTYVDGEKHGHWILRTPSGAEMQGSFVEGREQGVWYGETEICAHSEGVSQKITVRGKYVDGQKRGYWQNGEFHNATISDGPGSWSGSGQYDTNGLRQGTWTYRFLDCSGEVGAYWIGRRKGDFVADKRDGAWFYYFFWEEEGSRSWVCSRTTYDQGNVLENKTLKLKDCRRMDW